MKETKKEKDVKECAQAFTITPVFPGKEQDTNQPLSGCPCGCSSGTDKMATALQVYSSF